MTPLGDLHSPCHDESSRSAARRFHQITPVVAAHASRGLTWADRCRR